MPAPAVVAPVRKPKSLGSVSPAILVPWLRNNCKCPEREEHQACCRNVKNVSTAVAIIDTHAHHTLPPPIDMTNKSSTHPPLKAPTGFLTGAMTASCLSAALVWKLRVTAGVLVATERRIRDAIVVDLLAMRSCVSGFWVGRCRGCRVVWHK
jgi:hypothetical protein